MKKNFYYSIWYLNLALWMRKTLRRWIMVNKNGPWHQRGKIRGAIGSFFEVFLDLNHQETFTKTIPNRAAKSHFKELKGFHVPEHK